MFIRLLVISLTLFGVMLFSPPSFAREVRDVQVVFESGAITSTTNDIIIGYKTVSYKLRGRSGQAMVVILDSSNASNYFNVYAPGKGPGDKAMFIGSMNGGRYDGILPEDGEYTVHVFLMRNAARRNEKADYTLKFQIH